MTKSALKCILDELTRGSSLNEIGTIKQVSYINWSDIPDEELDICSDIIIRISADCLLWHAVNKNLQDGNYKTIMKDISKNILDTNFTKRSEEFNSYFIKFCQYIDEMQ